MSKEIKFVVMGKPSNKEISNVLLSCDYELEDITVIMSRRGTEVDSVTAHLGVKLLYYPNRKELANDLGELHADWCLIWPEGESEEDIADMTRHALAAGIDTHIYAEAKHES